MYKVLTLWGWLLNAGIFMLSHLSSMLLATVLGADWGSEGQSQCLHQHCWSPSSTCSLRRSLWTQEESTALLSLQKEKFIRGVRQKMGSWGMATEGICENIIFSMFGLFLWWYRVLIFASWNPWNNLLKLEGVNDLFVRSRFTDHFTWAYLCASCTGREAWSLEVFMYKFDK